MAVLWRGRRSKHMIIDKRMHRKGERERACEWCRGVSSLCTLCVNTLPLASSWHALTLIPMLHSSQLISASLTSSHLKLWVKYLTSSNLFSSHFSSYVMHPLRDLGDAPRHLKVDVSIRNHCPKPHGNPFRCRKKPRIFAQAFHTTALRLLRISENWPKAKKPCYLYTICPVKEDLRLQNVPWWCGQGQGRKSRNAPKNQKTNPLRSICSLLNWGLVSYTFLTQSIKANQITHWTHCALRELLQVPKSQAWSNSQNMQGHWQALQDVSHTALHWFPHAIALFFILRHENNPAFLALIRSQELKANGNSTFP